MGTNDEPDDLDEMPEGEWKPIHLNWRDPQRVRTVFGLKSAAIPFAATIEGCLDQTIDDDPLGWMLARPLQLEKGDVLEVFIDEHPRIIVRSPDGMIREYPLRATRS